MVKFEFKSSLRCLHAACAVTIAVVTLLSLLIQDAHAVQSTISLKEFQAKPGPLKFLGASARHDLYIPIYAKELLDSIEIDLVYTNSVSLLPDISQIMVLADGFVIGQAAMAGSRPERTEKFTVPAELLNSDAMRLSIVVNQHYDTDCENPYAGQLWTHVNPVKSKLTFIWKALPPCTTLRQWINLFAPANPFLKEVALVVPQTGKAWIGAASDVSAWLASVRQYRPVYFRISQTAVPGLPNVIIGPESFVKQVIEQINAMFAEDEQIPPETAVPGPISGPAAALITLHFPNGKSAPCMALTGPSEDDAASAASRVAAIQQNWPENSLMLLQAGRDEAPPYERACLRPEKEYTFKKLGLFSNMTFQGMGIIEESVSVYIPPELYRQENRYAKLHLDIIYSAGLREDSSLHVNVNSTIAGSIGLNNPDGETFSDYLINIPMSFFRPGHNNLSFKVIMKPLRAQKCAPIGQESMVTAILNSSRISIPTGFEHYILPDLAMLMDDMFPLSLLVEKGTAPCLVATELSDMGIFEAAVNISAIFAKKLDTPYNHLIIATSLPADYQGHALFVSTFDALPEELRDALPAFGSEKSIKYQLPGKKEQVLTLRNSIDDSRLLLSEMEFPMGSSRTAVVISAKRSLTIKKGVELIGGSGASKLYGDTSVIDITTGTVKSYRLNRKYQTGRLGVQGPVGNWLTSRPEYYYPLLAAVVFITALAILYLIRRRKKAREESV